MGTKLTRVGGAAKLHTNIAYEELKYVAVGYAVLWILGRILDVPVAQCTTYPKSLRGW